MNYKTLLRMEWIKLCARLNIVFSLVIFALLLLQVAFILRLDIDGIPDAATVNGLAGKYVNNIAFTFIPILLLVNIGREFDYGVVQRSLVSGLSRVGYFMAKLVQLSIFSVFAFLLAVIFNLLTALLYQLPIEWDFGRLAMYFVVSFCLGALAMLIVLLFKRRMYALTAFIIYVLLENMLAAIAPEKTLWLPFQTCKRMLAHRSYGWQEFALVATYSFTFLCTGYRAFRKSDLG